MKIKNVFNVLKSGLMNLDEIMKIPEKITESIAEGYVESIKEEQKASEDK